MVTAGPALVCLEDGGMDRLLPAVGGAVFVHLAVAVALLVVPPAAGDRVPDPGTFEVVFEEPAPQAPRIEDLPVTEAEPAAEPAAEPVAVAEAVPEAVPVPEEIAAEPAPPADPVPVSEVAEVVEVRQPLPAPPRPVRRPISAPEKPALVQAAAVAAPPPAAAPRTESGSSAAAASGQTLSYIARLQAWLERHKSYPRRARQDRIEGSVLLHFAVGRGGELLAYRIQRSSGHGILDEATIDLIRRAQPLPPMPDDLDKDRLEIVVPILYALKR